METSQTVDTSQSFVHSLARFAADTGEPQVWWSDWSGLLLLAAGLLLFVAFGMWYGRRHTHHPNRSHAAKKSEIA